MSRLLTLTLRHRRTLTSRPLRIKSHNSHKRTIQINVKFIHVTNTQTTRNVIRRHPLPIIRIISSNTRSHRLNDLFKLPTGMSLRLISHFRRNISLLRRGMNTILVITLSPLMHPLMQATPSVRRTQGKRRFNSPMTTSGRQPMRRHTDNTPITVLRQVIMNRLRVRRSNPRRKVSMTAPSNIQDIHRFSRPHRPLKGLLNE